ncbi:hypothetical protein BDK51DRAFT_18922 [Blyttiomyces helicus]|uniref:NADH-ubiquinone reductase complex 1 MLRQ subunit-domain-containing protein n=1 Tax=Blyttiomyces helicus TaxID=388810 RepID=A0A4P9WKI4_9FUNG|nr:hypothetical protein BDK51DRAFT_18922 [Blyttiomyces helicus]|eukprot:RKO93491.1 hypothetical protein BDK51DRAFT_18922 [Blyttiomyces helicus]
MTTITAHIAKLPLGVYPLFAFMGIAVGGAGFHIARIARGPDVVWAKSSNPHPWLAIEQNMTPKLYDPSGRFESWKRPLF